MQKFWRERWNAVQQPPSTFIANEHNEPYTFCAGKGDFVTKKISKVNSGGCPSSRPPPAFNSPLLKYLHMHTCIFALAATGQNRTDSNDEEHDESGDAVSGVRLNPTELKLHANKSSKGSSPAGSDDDDDDDGGGGNQRQRNKVFLKSRRATQSKTQSRESLTLTNSLTRDLRERRLTISDTSDHLASRVTSSRTSFYMRFTN